MEMAERIWQIVAEWGSFEKQTIGRQWVRAADSVAANTIPEGRSMRLRHGLLRPHGEV